MEQIEKLARLVNMEPLMVILIGAGIILLVFGLGAAVAAKRRKRVVQARKAALKKGDSLERVASSCREINEPFSRILAAVQALPEGEAFLKQDEIATALQELEGTVIVKPAARPIKKKKTSRDLSLIDHSVSPAPALPPGSARKPMVRIVRALYMDRPLLQLLKERNSVDLKKAVESLTE